ncbi:hypothetical protein HBHAL_2629 [Halobacillus halophilus DSM 2266]|uniref:Uncharacterized protein n=1 Tax=Halobacillus halophilus (strain ATCC 35676 / DSM 2266 / JCM 20832 / KCTC 3685 / LMG 17431 / NBRC 102448 / NCIMB 2269) TaxID=866895 RepID=I0JLG0_HALH3|nr:hypothetical protein HBHAL_2629 [Halobacillus halophilus DSM 2266]
MVHEHPFPFNLKKLWTFSIGSVDISKFSVLQTIMNTF